MKRLYRYGIAVAAFLLFIAAPVSAELVKLEPLTGQFVVYDNVNELQWIADLTMFNEPYADVITHIASLNVGSFAGVSDWHLASSDEISMLIGEIGVDTDKLYLFTYTDYFSFGPESYEWDGTIDVVGTDSSHQPAHQTVKFTHDLDADVFTFFWSASGLLDECSGNGAWVVSDSAPVPEPASMLLFGAGLAGLVGFRKKFKK